MKSFFGAVLMGVMAVGCAEGIDDPQPGPDPTAPASPAVAQPYSAALPDSRIDPTQLTSGLTAPKAEQQDPSPHPGWLDVKPNIQQATKVDVERTFDVPTIDRE